MVGYNTCLSTATAFLAEVTVVLAAATNPRDGEASSRWRLSTVGSRRQPCRHELA
jgi:hypothetical protein